MGKLVINHNPDVEKINLERAKRFLNLSTEQKLASFFSLIRLAVLLNHGKPLKQPQKKGLLITKLK